MKLRKELVWFSERMEDKLQANNHKAHWTHCSEVYLLNRLKEEIVELKQSMKPGLSIQNTIDECADIANFAMMIADKMRLLRASQEEE